MSKLQQKLKPILENGKLKSDIVIALQNFLFLKAKLAVIEPINAAICKKAMQKFKPTIVMDDAFKDCEVMAREVGKEITDFNELYQADDDLSSEIFAWHNAELAKAGFTEDNPKFCPFLVAQNDLSEAACIMINSVSDLTKLNSDRLYGENMKKAIKYVSGLLISVAKEQKIELNLLKDVA